MSQLQRSLITDVTNAKGKLFPPQKFRFAVATADIVDGPSNNATVPY